MVDSVTKQRNAPAKRRTSLADVAKAAGVTTATVSRVLNNCREGFSVRAELGEQIREAARKLGYRPDLVAQSLRKSKMGMVGLLGVNMPMIIPEHTVRALVEVLETKHIKLTTYFAPTIEASHDLPPWRIDAAVMAGVIKESDVAAVEQARLPYVSINGWCGTNGSSIQFDDKDGGRQAMACLLRLGHTRIAYANERGPWITHPSVQIRHQAYLDALAAAGLQPLPDHDKALPDPPHPFVRRMVEECGATAILAYHHFHAVHILQSAYDLGIRVPQQLSVICWNDDYPTQFVSPILSVVRLPTHDAGRIAAEMLIEQLTSSRKTSPQTQVLREELVVRGSTAPPPKS